MHPLNYLYAAHAPVLRPHLLAAGQTDLNWPLLPGGAGHIGPVEIHTQVTGGQYVATFQGGTFSAPLTLRVPWQTTVLSATEAAQAARRMLRRAPDAPYIREHGGLDAALAQADFQWRDTGGGCDALIATLPWGDEAWLTTLDGLHAPTGRRGGLVLGFYPPETQEASVLLEEAADDRFVILGDAGQTLDTVDNVFLDEPPLHMQRTLDAWTAAHPGVAAHIAPLASQT